MVIFHKDLETILKCIIHLSAVHESIEMELSIKQLHDFIGTLLHVQQKIKNRKWE